jgi:hypothetical protein
MNVEPITQEAQTIAVHKEIQSASLMEAKRVEDAYQEKQIDEVQEFNAFMEAGVMLNQGNYFDLYV